MQRIKVLAAFSTSSYLAMIVCVWLFQLLRQRDIFEGLSRS